MIREDIEGLERRLMQMVVKRRQLGGYSTDAADLLVLAETMMETLRHIRDQMPRAKK